MNRCPELLYSPEVYFAGLAIAVGAVLRLAKLVPKLPADAVPALAFAIGYGLDLAVGVWLCGRGLGVAATASLAGGLAGLAASGGHEALVRAARLVGLGTAAERLLGRAEKERSKRTGAAATLLVVLTLGVSGCGGQLSRSVGPVVAEVTAANNEAVGKLQAIHDATRAQRRRVLNAIAETAPSLERGEQEIRAAVLAYSAAFDAFQAAAKTQNTLAEILEAAQVSIEAGDAPDLSRVLRLYAELQQAYAAVMAALAEVR